ncbi:MAG: ATP-binding protein [Candidatus Nanogingivalaceae bacterium]|nr:MAG: ATP-binding protein [Candidatus Nanogingivalaceae bacterium]
MDAKEFFRKINTIENVEKIISNTEDGENDWLEFKGVHNKLKGSKKESAKARILFAKEICAFANTDGGILIIGVKKNDSGLEVLNNEDNLEDWFDANSVNMLEPKLHGFSVKSIDANGKGNDPIAVYIPKSNLSPHRVKSNYNHLNDEGKGKDKYKEIAGEYFVRRGTKSEKLGENLVRAMYLSGGRYPSFKITPIVKYTFIGEDVRSTIKVGLKISPDKYKFIKDYYLDSRVVLLDNNFHVLLDEDIDMLIGKEPPIYPSANEYILRNFTIKIDDTHNQGGISGMPTLSLGELKVPLDVFRSIKYIVVNLKYACEGMQLVDETFYFVVFRAFCYTPGEGIRFIESEKYHNIYVDERCLSRDKLSSIVEYNEDCINQQCSVPIEELAKKYSIPKKIDLL